LKVTPSKCEEVSGEEREKEGEESGAEKISPVGVK